MHPMISASFDRFARYQHVQTVRPLLGADPIDILDVGDPYGTLDVLFPHDRTVSVDVYAESPPAHDRHRHVVGSGFDLPFPDDSFDLVTTHDTLEHVPVDRKTEFLAELVRVARGPVVVVAPFADPRTRRCEEMANAYYVARMGYEMYQLTEHAASGLPALEEILTWADENSLPYRLRSDGWLYHWLSLMLLKIHLLSEREDEVHRRVDTAVNLLLRDQSRRRPHYRRAIVLNPPAGLPDEDVTDAEDDIERDLELLAEIASELSIALPRATDPIAMDSPLRRWIDLNAQEEGVRATTANDLRAVLDAVATDDVEATAATAGALPVPVPTSPDRAKPLPSVAIVLVNLNGAEHLVTCLDSLMAQDYPASLLEIVVVDNASTDGSQKLMADRFPSVRVLQMSGNTGFSPAVNTGVQAVDAQCVVLLNNDAKAEPNFVTELVRAYDPANRVMCVAGRIMSWDGEEIDFVEGAVNYQGMGIQQHYGKPAASVPIKDGQELLFACGGAMLVDRETFVNAGGLDPAFFAYFEDVDFGWRLWLLGFRVVMAADAVAYHRMHGTSSRFPLHQRFLLYERNALRMLLKNYSDANLQRVLGPALLLTIKRALIRSESDRGAYAIGGDRAGRESVARLGYSHIHAIGDIVDDLDDIMRDRATIQRGRARSDQEIFRLFKRPFHLIMNEPDYAFASESVTRAFGLDTLFTQSAATRLLVVCNDGVGERMSGPAIRAVELAKAMRGVAEVTLAVPDQPAVSVPGVTIASYDNDSELRLLADGADVTLFQGYTLSTMPALVGTSSLLVADLYDPWLFENIELHTGDVSADAALRRDTAVLNEILDECDFFICASERQRDYWLGMLSSRHRLTQGQYAGDPTLRHLIDVVPFGLPERPPEHRRQVLKGVHEQVATDDLVVLWGGGAWDWFDPLAVIEAWPSVVAAVPNAKLFFMGLALSNDEDRPMRMASRAAQRAKELGLADTSVIFGDWVPYELRESYLVEADVAVTVARDLAETRLSFRTRVLDYLWAGLPTVTTTGDVLSDLIRNERLGLVVDPGAPAKLAAAIIELLQRPDLREQMASRARVVSTRYLWSTAAEPLRAMMREPWHWDRSRRLRPRHDRVTEDLRQVLDDLSLRRGRFVSGPRAAAATDRAAHEARVRLYETLLGDDALPVRIVRKVRRSKELGVRRTAAAVVTRARRMSKR